jgi:hypothetical protein
LKSEIENQSIRKEKAYLNDRAYLDKIERSNLMAEKNDKIKFL